MAIRINTNDLNSKINELRIEKRKIDSVLEDFKGDSLEVNEYWSGDTGDLVSDELKSYTTVFDYISNQLEEYIEFLEEVSKAYEDEDILINKNIEKNGNVSPI